MTAVATVFGRVGSFVPLIVLSLGLGFVAVVAVLRPTAERQAMVDRLAIAIRDLALAASGVSPWA
jgi:hypothetical protein